MRNHRGFTLIEILISLVIMGLVTGAIYTLLTTTQRVSRAQTERTELQSNVRAGMIIVPAELREINMVPNGAAEQNDVLAITGTSIEYRAMRGLGFICQPPTATDITLWSSTFSGYRRPAAVRDAAYVFLENDPNRDDDVWLPVTITDVTIGGTLCPGSKPGIKLTVVGVGLTSVLVGSPVRTWERMKLELYPQDGEFWLGARSISAGELVPQPVLGPLTSNGFALQGIDSTGAGTSDPNKVRSIQVTIRGLTDQAITQGTTGRGMAHVQDSLVTQVTLRNALR